jgi:quinol-cytochrome oxidoreductase complex cytochrome b subunit
LWALHRFGSNNPLGVEVKLPEDTLPFHPYFTIKDLFGLGVFLIVYSYFVFITPDYLLSPDNANPANPSPRRHTSCPNGICFLTTRSCAPSPTSLPADPSAGDRDLGDPLSDADQHFRAESGTSPTKAS